MIAHLRSRLSAWQYATEHAVAPHVDRRWAQTALFELRMLGVDGARIGEVLAEVDSHCAESGQSAADAFGDPVAYVRSLELPDHGDETDDGRGPDGAVAAAASTVQVLGMFAVLWGFGAWLAAESLSITDGQLVMSALLLAVIGLVAWQVDRVLRVVLTRPIGALTGGVLLGTGLLVAIPLLLLDTVVLTAGPGWALGGGGLLLVAGSVGLGVHLGADAGVDVVRPPLPAAAQESRHADRADRAIRWLTPLLVPLGTAALMLLTWLTARP